MNLRSFVSLDSRHPVAFPALVSFLLFAAVIGLALAFSGKVRAEPPSQFDLKMSLSDREGPNPRDLLTLSVYSRASGRIDVYEHCKDWGHYWSNDRSQPVGYAYFTCEKYGDAGPSAPFDIAPQTMAISMFIDGETREECAIVFEGYNASYNNRFYTLTCR